MNEETRVNEKNDEGINESINENPATNPNDERSESETTIKRNSPPLKVKADPPDISPDDRKRNVKKLAGAISHSLRNNGEVVIRCFGNAAIGKATKALAIARNYIKVQKPNRLSLECSPAFITTKIGDGELTGIAFCTFASERPEDAEDIDITQCKSILLVKADGNDVPSDEKTHNVKKLAGAITHAAEENREVVVRCFGNACIGKAAKAIAIARGYTATKGPDLYCWPEFIVAKMGPNNEERTGIGFYCFTNEI